MELAANSRDLAKRARKLAEETDDYTIRLRLERYATEIEAETLKLEQAVIH
jgi:hypothetical protein